MLNDKEGSPPRLTNEPTFVDYLLGILEADPFDDYGPAKSLPRVIMTMGPDEPTVYVGFYHRKRETLCVLRAKSGKKVTMEHIAIGSALCAPEDKFDALTGKRLALRRALAQSAVPYEVKLAIIVTFAKAERQARAEQRAKRREQEARKPETLSQREVQRRFDDLTARMLRADG